MNQKAIAKECADWIRKKVTFKSNTTGEDIQGFINISSDSDNITYFSVRGFTTVDIGCERGNYYSNIINRFTEPFSSNYIQLFESLWNDKKKLQDVTETVIENICTAYNENSPEFI